MNDHPRRERTPVIIIHPPPRGTMSKETWRALQAVAKAAVQQLETQIMEFTLTDVETIKEALMKRHKKLKPGPTWRRLSYLHALFDQDVAHLEAHGGTAAIYLSDDDKRLIRTALLSWKKTAVPGGGVSQVTRAALAALDSGGIS